MLPVVIEAPLPAVAAADAKAMQVFSAEDADDYVNALLAVAQSHIDGVQGIGRAIGLQTLEITVPAGYVIETARLPLQPFVDTVSDTMSPDGAARAYRWRAGYGAAPAKPLPAALKHVIIMMAGVLRAAVPADEGAVKSKTVDGVGRWDFAPPADAVAAMQKVADSLLKNFRPVRL